MHAGYEVVGGKLTYLQNREFESSHVLEKDCLENQFGCLLEYRIVVEQVKNPNILMTHPLANHPMWSDTLVAEAGLDSPTPVFDISHYPPGGTWRAPRWHGGIQYQRYQWGPVWWVEGVVFLWKKTGIWAKYATQAELTDGEVVDLTLRIATPLSYRYQVANWSRRAYWVDRRWTIESRLQVKLISGEFWQKVHTLTDTGRHSGGWTNWWGGQQPNIPAGKHNWFVEEVSAQYSDQDGSLIEVEGELYKVDGIDVSIPFTVTTQ